MTATAAPAEPTALASRRQRLSELQAEHEQVSAELQRVRRTRAEHVAAGQDAKPLDRIITRLTDQLTGMDGAIALLESQIDELEVEAAETEVEHLEAMAVKLEQSYRQSAPNTASDLLEAALEFLKKYQELRAKERRALAAKKALLRAQGADNETLYYAELNDRGMFESRQAEEDFWSIAKALARYAEQYGPRS